MNKEVILTGLRANAQMHLGNYLGAIKPMVELQQRIKDEEGLQLNMFVPDLHSFTTPVDHDNLYQNSLDNIRVFVAAGLELTHERTFLYRQSYIPAHSEMTWILSCFTYYGELRRMTQFKEKTQQSLKTESAQTVDAEEAEHLLLDDSRTQSVTSGLFIYPVLMAADILLYGAQWVPVGDDQRQHLELTRDIGQRMNNKFGDMFSLPHEWQKQLEFTHRTAGVRIRSLRNPRQKMSKSVEDPAGTILLSDSSDEAKEKVMSATTDSVGAINMDWENQPGISNLLQILALLRGRTLNETADEWQGKSNYGELKNSVADAVADFLTDFRAAYQEVDEVEVIKKLEHDEAVMTENANETLRRVQQAVGLRPNG